MNPLPAPTIPGKTDAERFNNALRKVFQHSKQTPPKAEANPQPKSKKE
jgi:hypothetical protein